METSCEDAIRIGITPKRPSTVRGRNIHGEAVFVWGGRG